LFVSVEMMHKRTQELGQSVISSTARLGQDCVGNELRDLAARLTALVDDATRLESSLESLLKLYEELSRSERVLTEWLAGAERQLEQLNRINIMALETLEDDCEVYYCHDLTLQLSCY